MYVPPATPACNWVQQTPSPALLLREPTWLARAQGAAVVEKSSTSTAPAPVEGCSGATPINAAQPGGSAPPAVPEMVITREFIQEVCQPFFEQMLTALHREVNARLEGEALNLGSGLLSTAPWKSRDFSGSTSSRDFSGGARDRDDGPVSTGGAFSAVFDQAPLTPPIRRQAPVARASHTGAGDEARGDAVEARIPQTEPLMIAENLLPPGGSRPQAHEMPGKQSQQSCMPFAKPITESRAASSGAGTGPAASLDGAGNFRLVAAGGLAVEATPAQPASSLAATETFAPQEDAGRAKNVSVCHHWKAKGLCRLGADCKFLHPDHKKGLKARKANKGTGAPQVAGSSAQEGQSLQQQLRGGVARQGQQKAGHQAVAAVTTMGVATLPGWPPQHELDALAAMTAVPAWPSNAGGCEEAFSNSDRGLQLMPFVTSMY